MNLQTALLPWLTDNAFRANSSHGFIYLNNPKAGCSAIKKSLWLAITGHTPDSQNVKVHAIDGSVFTNKPTEPSDAESAFIFTFVRNPFQRIVSTYLDKIVRQTTQVWSLFAARHGIDPNSHISFDEFVELIANLPAEESDPHWRPQHCNILFPFVQPNLLADLESLDSEMPKLLARLVPNAEPQVLQSGRHHTKARTEWRNYFQNAATVGRVLQLYAADFEVFGYRPDVDGDPACMHPPRMSEHKHVGLGRYVAYNTAVGPNRFGALNALEAADETGALKNWITLQRLRQPKRHKTDLPTLLQGLSPDDVPNYLRRAMAKREGKD